MIPEVDVVAVADVDEEVARAKADQLGATQAFGDYRQMLRSIQADFVTVCVRRPHERSEMMLAAVEAGQGASTAKSPLCARRLKPTP